MPDAEARKLLTQAWAGNGDRMDPSDVGLDRDKGWPVAYEQPGTGFEPEREIWNQILYELSIWAREKMEYGGPIPYDPRVDYRRYGRCTAGIHKYIALVANGPARDNVTHPQAANNSIWILH